MNDASLDEAYTLRQAGNVRAAFEACRRLIASNPTHHGARSLAGLCLVEAGEVDQARPLIEEAVAAEPDNWRFLVNLSVLREIEGRTDDAIASAREATVSRPDRFETWGRLGELSGKRGDLAGAAGALEKAVALRPDHSGLTWLLAGAAYETGQYELAERALDQFEKVSPGRPEALRLRMHLARKQGDFDTFVEVAVRWMNSDPGSEEARVALAFGQSQQADYHAAVDTYRSLVEAKPEDPDHLATFAQYLLWTRDFEGADSFYRRALVAKPDHAAAAAGLARLNIYKGKLEEAAELARKAIESDSSFVDAYSQLALAEGSRLSEENFARLHSVASDSRAESENRAIAWFTIGDVYHRRGDYDQAFEAWKRANDLKHDASERSPTQRYDRRAMEQLIDRLIASFADVPSGLPQVARSGPQPIFIVGMPRSGTTLLDSALSGHAKVASAGELPAMPSILTRFLEWADEAKWRGGAIPESIIPQMRDAYLRQYADYRIETAPFVTDKQPLNFLSVGLIRHLFPSAPVIHIRRNALENGFSMYRRNFTKSWAVSTALGDIGHYYGQYARLMKHWDAVFGEGLATVQYEELVGDFEAEVRRLLAYAGLEWDPNCLTYFEREGIVTTLSSVQVRKAPSKDMMSSTGPYVRALQPLADALSEAGVDVSHP